MTSREQALLAEMEDLVESIHDHIERMSDRKRIQELEVDNVLMRVRQLMEKSAVLKYVHLEELAASQRTTIAAAPVADEPILAEEPQTANEPQEPSATAVADAAMSPPSTSERAAMEAALKASREAIELASQRNVQPEGEQAEIPEANAAEDGETELPPYISGPGAPIDYYEPEAFEQEGIPHPETEPEEAPPAAAIAAPATDKPEASEEVEVEPVAPQAIDDAEQEASAAAEVPPTALHDEATDALPAAHNLEGVPHSPADEDKADEDNASEAASDDPAPKHPQVAAEDVSDLRSDYQSLDVAGNTGASVNEKLAGGSGGDLASKLQKQPISDLKSSIGLNAKFQFINELFGGNAEAYNNAVDEFNRLSGMAEAQQLMAERGLNNAQPDAVQAFTELLERRYA